MSPTQKPKLTLYHNAGCSKCRATHEILKSSGREFAVVEYLSTPPTPETLDRLLQQLEMQPDEITRTHEDRYEELGLDRTPPKSRAEWLKLLSENPILIERPIVSDGTRAVIGRPPENVRKLL